MAFHRPDYKYGNGIKVLENLKDPNKELPRSLKDITLEEKLELLVYVINKKEEHIDLLDDKIKEYQKVFDTIGKFIPYKGPTVYG
jgi:hypothetical protein